MPSPLPWEWRAVTLALLFRLEASHWPHSQSRERDYTKHGHQGWRVPVIHPRAEPHSRCQTWVTRREASKAGVSLTQPHCAAWATLEYCPGEKHRSLHWRLPRCPVPASLLLVRDVWAATLLALFYTSVPSRLLQLASEILPVINM